MLRYPQLWHLMGAWFHQDFDVEGTASLEDVLGSYREGLTAEQRRALVDDIERFLREATDIDADFEKTFDPQVVPTAFAPSTREFLERIAALART